MARKANGNGNGNGNGRLHAADLPGRPGRGARTTPGSRLAEAFEAVERFPVLIESRERVIAAATAETSRIGELVGLVESDVALAILVLRSANRGGVPGREVGGIPAAIEALKPSGVLAIAGTAPVFDFFDAAGTARLHPEQFRLHALATQLAAVQLGRAADWEDRDELAVAALLHDVGRLVVGLLHPGFKADRDVREHTPEQRLREEREQLGIDHALVGGVIARRWNLPQRIAVAIERHHAEDCEGLAALVGAADMVAHYAQGDAISAKRLRAVCERCGVEGEALRELLYELPLAQRDGSRITEPCPLSAREMDVLRHLSEGMVYKQIAGEMDLSVSTIRTHLHNVYGKIGAVDRAQAVLTARDRGWL